MNLFEHLPMHVRKAFRDFILKYTRNYYVQFRKTIYKVIRQLSLRLFSQMNNLIFFL